MRARVHIIGAGMAGLAAAVRLKDTGADITLYEAAPRAGGRCRSYVDPHLGLEIDNGNHLLLSGNHAVMAYLDAVGARDRLVGPSSTSFDFLDVRSGLRWSVRPGNGPVPWWILDSRRRVPDTKIADYWTLVRLMRADPAATVADCIGTGGVLFSRFWEPLTLAVLNAAPTEGAASLMQAVLKETVAKGAHACRPLVARRSLADTFVDPALAALARAGVVVKFGARVEALAQGDAGVTALTLNGASVPVAADDVVVLAAPAWNAAELVPGLSVPPAGDAIVNIHYRLAAPSATPEIVGIVSGTSQWVFRRGEIASVTISAARAVADKDADDLAAQCWPEVAAALSLPQGPTPSAPMPPFRVIKERRATPAQTPAAVALRPKTQSGAHNLLLAGDWTDTGLPATIEGAVRSGFAAADIAAVRVGARDVHRGAA